jgi:uncharacterized protein
LLEAKSTAPDEMNPTESPLARPSDRLSGIRAGLDRVASSLDHAPSQPNGSIDMRSGLAWFVAFLMFMTPLARADETPGRSVTVGGTATRTVKPDRAEIRFMVTSYHAELATAKTMNDEEAQKVLNLLKALGIDESSIAIHQVAARRHYELNRSESDGFPGVNRGQIKGFNVVRSYRVTLKDLSRFGDLMDQLVSNPSVMVVNHELTSTELERIESELLPAAIRDAIAKATLAAEAGGARLGKVMNIVATDGTLSDRFGGTRWSTLSAGVLGGGGGAEAAPVGEITLQAQVQVTIELTDPAP